MVGEISERPAAVGRDQVEDPRHRRGVAADQQVAVEEDGGDPGALEQVAQVRIGAIQLLHLSGQLKVDGLQLLVDRLLLLLGGFQLLVG